MNRELDVPWSIAPMNHREPSPKLELELAVIAVALAPQLQRSRSIRTFAENYLGVLKNSNV